MDGCHGIPYNSKCSAINCGDAVGAAPRYLECVPWLLPGASPHQHIFNEHGTYNFKYIFFKFIVDNFKKIW